MIAVDEHITLRLLRNGDEYAISENGNNIKIWNNMRDFFPHPYTLQDGIQWVERNISSNTKHNLAICYNDVAIGMIGLIPGKDIDRLSAEVGYWLGEKYWGKGIMTRAVKAFSEYIFSNFEIIRLEAGVFEKNISSQKVLEKAGFYLESIRKFAYIKNNEYINSHLYVLIKPGLKK
ncbi:MAG: GNAT family N-acetyltransferase [Fimbriimonadaceae bacterium]|nr:GNAT family N-acetyltransferase [Chitinophagales bacterium]